MSWGEADMSVESKSDGFTLIELLVVISIIAIIASVAVPSFISGRASANEGAVVGTLRSISKAQFQFKALNLVDTDVDGGFEYGTLGEITGSRVLRGTSEKLAPRLMSVSLGSLDAAGHLDRHGYKMALYLPDGAGRGLAETAGNAAAIDPMLAQNFWTFVAWPTHDQVGRSTYFVNQQGQILKTAADYVSTAKVPEPGCALVGVTPDRIDAPGIAVSSVGADGNTWLPVH